MNAPSHGDKLSEPASDNALDVALKPSENISSLPSKDGTQLVTDLEEKVPDDNQDVDNHFLKDVISDENKELKPFKADILEVSTKAEPDKTTQQHAVEVEIECEIPGETILEISAGIETDREYENLVVSSDDFNGPFPSETSEEFKLDEVINVSYELLKEQQSENEQIDMVKLKSSPENERQDEPAHAMQPLGTPPPSYQTFLRSQCGKAAGEAFGVLATELEQQSTSNATPIPSTSFEPVEAKPVSKPQPGVSKDSSVHQIKWIQFEGTSVPVVTQNENGPCPMIAITNVLLLRRKISLSKDHEMVSSDLIIQILSDELFSQSTANFDEETRANYEENLYSAVSIFPKLQTGLDINVRFTGVADFEYTTALTVFDLFRIPIFHGWVADPQDANLVRVLNNQTYNQVVEMIIDYKTSEDAEQLHKGLIAEEFLESTASQLTLCGLCELNERLREGELAVFFRNNHFNTIYKKNGNIYVLLTDVGFVNEPNFVWETLNNIDGDCQFVNAEFKVVTESSPTGVTCLDPSTPVYPTQMDLAQRLALEQADLELAKQLQEEERVAFLKQSTAAASNPPPQDVSTTPTRVAETSPQVQSSQPQQTAATASTTEDQNEPNSPPSSSSSPSSSWQEATDLELARQLQAEEDAAYYAERQQQQQKAVHQPRSARSPQLQRSSQRRSSSQSPPTSHSSPPGNRGNEGRHNQHNRSNRYQRDPSPSWKCTIS